MFALIRRHVAFFPEGLELPLVSLDNARHSEETVDSNVRMPGNQDLAGNPAAEPPGL